MLIIQIVSKVVVFVYDELNQNIPLVWGLTGVGLGRPIRGETLAGLLVSLFVPESVASRSIKSSSEVGVDGRCGMDGWVDE